MTTDSKLLATIISNNIASSDIALDEVEHIVLHYIRLYNRLYQKSIDEKKFCKEVMETLRQKILS